MSVDVSSERIGLNMQQCEAMAIDLSNLVEADSAATGHQYDVLYAMPRGGFMPANVLSRRLGFETLDVVSGSLSSYELDSTTAGGIKYGQMPTRDMVEGKHILAVDEVSDTDITLEALREHAFSLGALSVKTAVLVYKPGRNVTGVIPDFYVLAHNGWVDFYWEVHDEVGKNSVAKRRLSNKTA